jgi:hypothetical protein
LAWITHCLRESDELVGSELHCAVEIVEERMGVPSAANTLGTYETVEIGSNPLGTLPGRRPIVPIGAITIR